MIGNYEEGLSAVIRDEVEDKAEKAEEEQNENKGAGHKGGSRWEKIIPLWRIGDIQHVVQSYIESQGLILRVYIGVGSLILLAIFQLDKLLLVARDHFSHSLQQNTNSKAVLKRSTSKGCGLLLDLQENHLQ